MVDKLVKDIVYLFNNIKLKNMIDEPNEEVVEVVPSEVSPEPTEEVVA